jgi:hypothetical protein
VVEVHGDLDVGGSDSLITSELKLLNKILVRSLSHAAAFISVKVDIIDPERAILKRGNTEDICATVDVNSAVANSLGADVALALLADGKIDANLVVLKSNEGKSKTRVAAEPELKRDIKSSCLSRSKTCACKGDGVSDHVVVSDIVSGLLSKLVPNVEPLTIVAVNALSTDLDLDLLDEDKTDVVAPTEARRSVAGALDLGKSNLEVNAVDEIAIT